MEELPVWITCHFKSRLWILTAIDLMIGVALLLLLLSLLDKYFLDDNTKTQFKDGDGLLTLVVGALTMCFIAEPVAASTVLLRHTEADTVEEMRMVKTWLKLCNGFVVVVIPELFLFLTFYNLYQPSSILGVILCIFKLVLYFHKINLVSAYARQHQLTASYPSDGSITPDVPSYGAFAPPSYEDAIKSRDGVPLPDGNYNPVNEKET